MKPYKFYKESDGRWYIDLPQYLEAGGDKADLEMVAGADTFLDIIAEGKTNVYALLSEQPFENCDELTRIHRDTFSGSYYLLQRYRETVFDNFEMWLCDVTAYVFGGKFPDTIYFAVENES